MREARTTDLALVGGVGYSAPVRLAEILTVDRVTVSMSAQDKDEALRQLAGMFSGVDEQDVYRVFRERESLASTGVGSGVAIPHGRMKGIPKLEAALAVSPRGIDFESVDGEPVYILVAVLAPEHGTGDHLKALARVSRLLRADQTRQALMTAVSPEDAHAVALDRDASV